MQAKLELVWIPHDAPARAEPRLRVQPSDPPAAPQEAEAPTEFVISICGSPRCGCSTIHLENPAAKAVEPESRIFPADIWLDLETKSLVRGSDATPDPAFERFDDMVRTRFTDADLQALRGWFFAEKLHLIHTTPVSEIEIHDLPDVTSGLMVGFIDVFPRGLAFSCTFEDELWAVSDQYCVQPGCTCSETVLSFLPLHDRPGLPGATIREPPALRYNYLTHKTRPLSDRPAHGPDRTDLLGALKAAFPKLDGYLQFRHLILQSLYVRKEIERATSQTSSILTSIRPKIGRNDPCPCGSGRKFKHCCLNKVNPASRIPG
ncbi:MAG: SEC-C domain-containing protein [Verrucomicrobiae bacterium]|nr:SEC-C domain-containing protein [Verrucomicrobiae bacterium]